MYEISQSLGWCVLGSSEHNIAELDRKWITVVCHLFVIIQFSYIFVLICACWFCRAIACKAFHLEFPVETGCDIWCGTEPDLFLRGAPDSPLLSHLSIKFDLKVSNSLFFFFFFTYWIIYIISINIICPSR